MLEWFESQKQREIGPWREFQQELLDEGLGLSATLFPYVIFRWVRRHETGIGYSEHFQCWEYKMADIFEAELSTEQQQALRAAARRHPKELGLFTAEQIRNRGVTTEKQCDSVAETGPWLLD